jgi:sugar lactone lactonase YvrE
MAGIGLGESPRWHDGRLWVADWIDHQIVAVDLRGKHEVVSRVDAFPFSLDWRPDGQMLVVAGNEQRVLRQERDGRLVPHAELRHISDRTWNELVVDGRGNAYLNNIGFDMMAGEQPTTGIVALLTADGAVRQVADGVSFPNGMAVTPDNATLIVAESYANTLTAFDIEPNGSLTNQRVWANVDGYPDGICLDADGAVWYADVPNKRCQRVREGGQVLQTIELDRGCFACMLGGPDGRTLFVVAAEWQGPSAVDDVGRTGIVVTIDAPAPHAGWP